MERPVTHWLSMPSPVYEVDLIFAGYQNFAVMVSASPSKAVLLALDKVQRHDCVAEVWQTSDNEEPLLIARVA